MQFPNWPEKYDKCGFRRKLANLHLFVDSGIGWKFTKSQEPIGQKRKIKAMRNFKCLYTFIRYINSYLLIEINFFGHHPKIDEPNEPILTFVF